MKRYGMSLSYGGRSKESNAMIKNKITAFDNCHTKEPLTLSDEELRSKRLTTKYTIKA